jgi:glycerol kinase
MDINDVSWSKEMCNLLNVPIDRLPEIKNSADEYGETSLFGGKIKISGIAGDQQAALFGQGCFKEGEAKSTYGTGCFMMLNTGPDIKLSQSNLLSTIGYQIDGKVSYALEGSIFMAGASVQWLRDNLEFFSSASEIENLAKNSNKNSNVSFIPAFTGLGAPYWDPEVRGAIFGLSRETTKNDISQALLEAIAFQTKDVFECMSSDGVDLKTLKIDGGMVENKYFNQILADVLNLKILLPDNKEATAKGAAFLASLGSKHTNSLSDLNEFLGSYEQFTPLESRDSKYQSWKSLVSKILA